MLPSLRRPKHHASPEISWGGWVPDLPTLDRPVQRPLVVGSEDGAPVTVPLLGCRVITLGGAGAVPVLTSWLRELARTGTARILVDSALVPAVSAASLPAQAQLTESGREAIAALYARILTDRREHDSITSGREAAPFTLLAAPATSTDRASLRALSAEPGALFWVVLIDDDQPHGRTYPTGIDMAATVDGLPDLPAATILTAETPTVAALYDHPARIAPAGTDESPPEQPPTAIRLTLVPTLAPDEEATPASDQQAPRQTSAQPPTLDSAALSVAVPPIRAVFLGPGQIYAGTSLVVSGMRRSSVQLLAWFCAHPDGATAGALVDALWPEVDRARGTERFWTALGAARTRLRAETGNPDLLLLERTGEKYHLVTDEVASDIAALNDHLAQLAGERDPLARLPLATTCSDLYTGPLLEGVDAQWLTPARETLNRRVIDALVRATDPPLPADLGALISVLERILFLEPTNETACSRLLQLLARENPPDRLAATWGTYLRGSALLDVPPSPALTALYLRLSDAL